MPPRSHLNAKLRLWQITMGILSLQLFYLTIGTTEVAAISPATFADSGQTFNDASSYHVILGDLDGDSDLDFFVANSPGPTPF